MLSRSCLGQHNTPTTGADLSRVDTSADDIRKDARATINDSVEKLRGSDLSIASQEEGGLRSECLGALSTVAELCREDGDAGQANRMAMGEVGTNEFVEQAARVGSRITTHDDGESGAGRGILNWIGAHRCCTVCAVLSSPHDALDKT